ncbi:uncharacterized protein METZ01_LOCUS220280 [marine metagenome]|jgi:hypothetical protein|uniref:HNH domain-containing protein n=1 Tax=marine metagenome TaxID=408172 RepID=A0A382FWG2_9ZZZZ
MRFRSKKRAKIDREAEDVRAHYDNLFPFCQLCGEPATDTHEIARGPSRLAAQAERCCLLHLCRDCHEEMGDYSRWPVERQLVLKQLVDPEGYDLDRFNQIRGRSN